MERQSSTGAYDPEPFRAQRAARRPVGCRRRRERRRDPAGGWAPEVAGAAGAGRVAGTRLPARPAPRLAALLGGAHHFRALLRLRLRRPGLPPPVDGPGSARGHAGGRRGGAGGGVAARAEPAGGLPALLRLLHFGGGVVAGLAGGSAAKPGGERRVRGGQLAGSRSRDGSLLVERAPARKLAGGVGTPRGRGTRRRGGRAAARPARARRRHRALRRPLESRRRLAGAGPALAERYEAARALLAYRDPESDRVLLWVFRGGAFEEQDRPPRDAHEFLLD